VSISGVLVRRTAKSGQTMAHPPWRSLNRPEAQREDPVMTSSSPTTLRARGTEPGASYPVPRTDAAATRRLLACGAVAGPLFVVTVLAQAGTRSGFSLTHDAASLLDDGPWGWVQSANFIVTGLLLIAAAAGLRRVLRDGRGSRWAPRLLAITGAGFIGGGIFHPDPSGGYPTGTPPDASAVSSWHGALHQVCGSAAFLALIVFCVILARRYRAAGQRRLAGFSLLAGVLGAVGVASGGLHHGTLTLFIGVSIALLWAVFAATRQQVAPENGEHHD
jgi:hypothetical protein